MDYAVAVLCDACQETGAEIKFVCTGHPAEDGRTPIEEAPQVKVKHDMMRHPEALRQIKWFDDSPDPGDPACICSLCGELIPEWPEDEPCDPRGNVLRLYRKPSKAHPHGQEARFCVDCVPAVLKYMTLK
jgi:hypothetical protein